MTTRKASSDLVSETISDLVQTRLEHLYRENPALKVWLNALGHVGRVALVGGTIRDWLYDRTPRDLDFVVDAPPQELEQLVGNSTCGRTRFGGFRVRIGEHRVDLWALATTWAFQQESRWVSSFEVLPQTAFFNIDAVAMALDTGTIYEHRFIEALSTHRLGINFERNPFPAICAARAVVLCEQFGLQLDPDVVAFLLARLANGFDVQRFQTAMFSHYGANMVDPHVFVRYMHYAVERAQNPAL